MGLLDWVAESATRYRRHSPGYATKRTGQELLKGVMRRLPNPPGTPIWDGDWDVLLVLDACRGDVFENRYEGAELFESVETRTSLGSASPEWMQKTFADRYEAEMAETAYVTGNPYSADHVPRGKLAHLDEVWRDSWDEELGTIRPDPLTARAVDHWRTERPSRLIVHYMQPHWPYVTDPVMYGFDPETVIGDGSTTNPFDRQNRGQLSKSDHIDRYRRNLEYVVDHLGETFLRAVDADRVVFTADHGELFGEWGLYKHPGDVPIRVAREVPWAVTSATDEGTYEPEVVEAESGHDADRDQQLRDLGYVE
ncbi:MAG: hypothetical protein ABEI99_04275 [Halobaculum sp.]